MRYALVALLCASVAFAAGKPSKAAPKKDDAAEGDTGDNDTSDDDDANPGAPEGSMKATPSDEGAKDGAGTAHTVEKGDTLWDLSQRYLGSPWYWPKVWSYNPEIANPHWIYPGNVVRFTSTGEEVPTQVEMGEPESVTPGELVDEDKVEVAGKIGYVNKSVLLFRSGGFATAKEVDEAGVIAGSFEEAEYLTSNEQVYLKFKDNKKAKLGDRFVVFKPGMPIYHPSTGDMVGYLTVYLGTAKIIRTDGPMVTAMITEAYDTILRGDMIAPYSEALSKRVAIKPNDKKLDGTIIAQIGMGALTTMVIDQGSNQGVQPGNTFMIMRQQDGLEHKVANFPAYRDERYPIEDIGACIAWEVKSTATSCVLVKSIREIVNGDMVQMRTGGSAASPRASR